MDDNTSIVDKTIAFVKETLKGAEPGHDWNHVNRVWKTAKHLAGFYSTNELLIDLGALLHDIADAKFHNGDEETGPQIASDFLSKMDVTADIRLKVLEIIQCISFKNADGHQPKFIEFKIVQDADRMDALGAIGIARAFSYGGYKNREMYNSSILPITNLSSEAYKKHKSPTLNHFYEKLLQLPILMNTAEAKEMAMDKQAVMQMFLEQFIKEAHLEDWKNKFT